MKEQSLKQRRSSSSNFLCYSTILVNLLAFISCSHQSSSHSLNNAVKKPGSVSNIRKNSFAGPKVIAVTHRNQSKVVKAGKPIINVDLSNGGIPVFTNYSTDQGLALNSVLCSATDKEGNIWFGTAGGVSRYDGKHFTNYSKVQGLGSNVVFNIIEDNTGNLWFATTDGASKYNGYSFTNYTKAQGLADNYVSSVMQDNAGNLWFGTHEGGVSRYNGKSFANYTKIQGLADNYVHCIMQDKKGNLWFGTDTGGVSKYDGTVFTNYTKAEGLANNSINSISQDNAGNIWFGTSAGASKYDGKKFTNYTKAQGLPDNNIACILEDKAGDIWFGTQQAGISKYRDGRFTNYSRAQGLPDNNVHSMLLDKSGNIWLTSIKGGGITKCENNGLTNYNKPQSLADDDIWSMIEDRSGNIWFGTYAEGVVKFDGKNFTNYTMAQGLAGNPVWNIMEDKTGNIWFGTERNGASKYDGKNFTNYTIAQGLPNNTVYNMMQDKKGNIWFGTHGGASKYDGITFTNYTTSQGLAGYNIQSIIEDKKGNLWFGTHDDGVSKYDGKFFTNYTTTDGLGSNTIYAGKQDENGNLWFGTNNGATKYDGKIFTNYTTAEGLADNNVWTIAEDTTRSIVWFGTNHGLSGLSLKKSTDNNVRKNEFENFNENNPSFPIKDVSNRALCGDSRGILWTGGGHDKLIRLDYSKLNKIKEPLNLEIENVKVNNENICWNNLLRRHRGNQSADSLTMLNEMITSFEKVLSTEILDSMGQKYDEIKFSEIKKFYPVPINLVLPYKDNSISIDFVAIETAKPSQVKYQYKLEGYNKDWSPLSNNPSASFGNIGAGNYIFKLKALSPSGVWSETVYSFKVLPPWWLTWWAYLLYGLMAAAILYTFYRNRIRLLERKQATQINIMLGAQEEERKRISRDLHDDIGARLTNINILSALGQQKINEPQETSEYLKRISNEIQTSAEALDDIVWSIDTKNDSMQEVTARLRRYAADVFDGTDIRYGIIADEKFLPAKLPMGKRRDLFLVFKETINNIQKHAMATEVKINIEAKDNNLLMQVNDNGKGFDTDQQTHRNGLKNIQQRMQKWGGTFIIQSLPGKGTTLKIELPVSSPSLKRGIWEWFKNR